MDHVLLNLHLCKVDSSTRLIGKLGEGFTEESSSLTDGVVTVKEVRSMMELLASQFAARGDAPEPPIEEEESLDLLPLSPCSFSSQEDDEGGDPTWVLDEESDSGNFEADGWMPKKRRRKKF
jgi:hypothetical protein